MSSKLLSIAWIVGILYSSIPLFWFAIHPFAGRWQRMRRSPFRALFPIGGVIITGLVFATKSWHSLRLYSAWWMWLAALPFLAMGFPTYLKIRSEFGRKRLTGEAEVRPTEIEQSLATTGLHGAMRHPIYFAHLSMFIGLTLGSGLKVNFVLLAVSVFCTFPLMIWLEERELEKRFGDSYRAYKKLVPLIPGMVSLYTYKVPAEGKQAESGRTNSLTS